MLRLPLAGGLALGFPLPLLGATPPPSDPFLAPLHDLFWALLLFGVVLCVGILWVGLVRYQIFRGTAAVRERESALEDSYRDLFENSHDLVFSLDLSGQFVTLNRAAELAFGADRADLAGRSFFDRVDPADRIAVTELLQRLQTRHFQERIELRCLGAAGQRLVLDLSLRLQRQDQRAHRIHVIGWDVTSRHRAEEALRASEHQLRLSLAEREQIGRDLHDGIIQSLYAIGLGLQDCRRLAGHEPARVADRLQQAIQDLNQVIRDVRSFIGRTAPPEPSAHPLLQNLQSMVQQAGPETAARFRFSIDPDAERKLDAVASSHLLQIAREAVSNSLRHSGARLTEVSLVDTGSALQLEIRDNGAGFDPQTSTPGTHGLKNIQARTARIGGRAVIDSSPARGTRVLIELPLR